MSAVMKRACRRTLAALAILAAGATAPALVILAAGATAAPAWAASDDILVVRSTARSLPTGTILKANGRIALGAGETVLLVDDTGRRLSLDGAYSGPAAERFSGPPSQMGGGAVASLATLLKTREVISNSVRSGDKNRFTKLPDPWLISVHDSGPACARGQSLVFWRADKQRDVKLTIMLGTGGKKANVTWAKDQDRLALPASLFASASAFKVELETASADFTMHQAPSSAVTPVDQAVWMTGVGCKAQALSMLDSLN